MVLGRTRKLVPTCLFIALSAMVILITHMIQINPFLLYNQRIRTRPVTSEEMTTKETPDTSISLFVRMSGVSFVVISSLVTGLVRTLWLYKRNGFI